MRFALLLLLCHMLAAAVVYATTIAWPIRLALFLLIFLSLLYHLARDILLLLPGSWREILLDQSGVSVTTRNGSGFTGQVVGNTVISPYFVLLRVRIEGRRLPVSRVIFPDALGVDLFRQLCVRLRFL
ncbi:MAG: hypothetical protein HY016_11670 [Nitrosomonadales bacterium]|nr:hypothetical protein [Nitrosomonadales bacterium]